MCQDCGCNDGGTIQIHTHPISEQTVGHSHPHHSHDHSHGHSHDHSHHHNDHHHNGHSHPEHHHNDQSHADVQTSKTLHLQQSVLSKNDRLAERNRGYFLAKDLLVLNMLSSPGSGKTAFLERTLADLHDTLPCGVVVGDLETDQDAQRLRRHAAPVVQITTGTLCHLEADMVLNAAQQLDLDDLDCLIIENVGNLVCPAAYDLGEQIRVVLLSVTEGEDKPLKYPTVFKSADIVVVSKIDIAEAVGFDRDLAIANIRNVAPQATLLEVSSRTGEGMTTWYEALKQALPKSLVEV